MTLILLDKLHVCYLNLLRYKFQVYLPHILIPAYQDFKIQMQQNFHKIFADNFSYRIHDP